MESNLFSLGKKSIGAKEACLELGRELRANSQLKFNVIKHLNGMRGDSSLEATSPPVEWSLSHVFLSWKAGLIIHNRLDHLVASLFLCCGVFAACSNICPCLLSLLIYLGILSESTQIGLLELSAIASATQSQETGFQEKLYHHTYGDDTKFHWSSSW